MLCLKTELYEEGTDAEDRDRLWEGTADADVDEGEEGILPVLEESNETIAAGLLRTEETPEVKQERNTEMLKRRNQLQAVII